MPRLAAETQVDDLRLMLIAPVPLMSSIVVDSRTSSVRIDSNDATITTGHASSETGDDTIGDANLRIVLGFYHTLRPTYVGRGAPLIGIEIGSVLFADTKYRGNGWMGDACLGWAWASGERWHVEAGALLGVGAFDWRIHRPEAFTLGGGETADFSDTSRGFAYEYGFRFGVFHTGTSGLQIGFETRFVQLKSQARYTGVASAGGIAEVLTIDDRITLSGLAVVLSAGYRF